ncbi:MAG: N4-gp56 family major capsid protein, partial [Clostridia bacterium]|nr:N4-gp56 family major capsid protein [Clostridia bacterium]
MANTPNTLGVLTAEQKTFYERTLLGRLLPNLVLYKYGQKKSVPKNEGKAVNFRRFNSLAAATTPLTEGQPGDGQSLDITTIVANLAQYGDYVTIT